jgi:hypothetical protein
MKKHEPVQDIDRNKLLKFRQDKTIRAAGFMGRMYLFWRCTIPQSPAKCLKSFMIFLFLGPKTRPLDLSIQAFQPLVQL